MAECKRNHRRAQCQLLLLRQDRNHWRSPLVLQASIIKVHRKKMWSFKRPKALLLLELFKLINCHSAVRLSCLGLCLVNFLFYFENNSPLVSGHLPFLLCPWSDVIPDSWLFPPVLPSLISCGCLKYFINSSSVELSWCGKVWTYVDKCGLM